MRKKVLLLALVAGLAGACDSEAPPSAPPAAPAIGPQAIPAPPDVAAIPADAVKTASGLAYKILKPGAGTIHPTPTSFPVVHYTGWKTNGEMFDSSVAKGEPLNSPGSRPLALNDLIPGWIEGMQLMVIGEKRRFWIPENLAYGGRPGSPEGMLVFDIELLDIKPAR
jgi:peptidylprolyl isomerase